MTAGLVVSVMGNRVIDGSFDSLTALGVIPIVFLALTGQIGELVVFLFPAYARILRRFSPDLALIATDITETILSTIAIAGILVFPDIAGWIMLGYVWIGLALSPIPDLADEFYGESLAAADTSETLVFNTSVDSLLAFTGFVIFSPLGALLAGIDVIVVFACNIVLSLVGASLRWRSRSIYPIPAPRENVDIDDYALTGVRVPLGQFFAELFKSGAASPLLSAIIGIATACSGSLFFIWVSRLANNPAHGMAITLICFGLGATIGPQLARISVKVASTRRLLQGLGLAGALAAGSFAVLTSILDVTYGVAVVFVGLMAVLSRARMSLLTTYRQTTFKGEKFRRIMSWSYAFGAGGTIVGIQCATILNVTEYPAATLTLAAVCWLGVALVVTPTSNR
ncbi:MFS transporter [Arcanobacterium ihumii]|uniref:MFS transporter n=1 Tax=Arcanobacterium ihumii TaxID=2138162 RepID=UPI001F4210BE|nr:MFS transporter [Arcanobacterium ihumii]